MDIGVNLINRGVLATPEVMTRFARRAEELGLNSITVSDHIVIPKAVPDNYPYHPQGEFHWEQARDYSEPLTTISFLAGATSRLRLGISVLIVSYRNPVTTAKMLATLDFLSGGRVFVGIGTGWWEDEYKALGIPGHFKERGARTDETLQIFRELWSNENPSFSGPFHQFGDLEFSPKPAQKPGVPIWIGGHTNRALRRVVEHGDAWHPIGLRPPAGLTPEELGTRRGELAAMLEKADRDPASVPTCFRAPVEFAAKPGGLLSGPPEKAVEDLRAYASQGVSHTTLDIIAGGESELFEGLDRIGQDVAPHLR